MIGPTAAGATVGVAGGAVGSLGVAFGVAVALDGGGSVVMISSAKFGVTNATSAPLSISLSNCIGAGVESARKTSTANCTERSGGSSGSSKSIVVANSGGSVPVSTTGGGARVQAVSGSRSRAATPNVALGDNPRVEKLNVRVHGKPGAVRVHAIEAPLARVVSTRGVAPTVAVGVGDVATVGVGGVAVGVGAEGVC